MADILNDDNITITIWWDENLIEMSGYYLTIKRYIVTIL